MKELRRDRRELERKENGWGEKEEKTWREQSLIL